MEYFVGSFTFTKKTKHPCPFLCKFVNCIAGSHSATFSLTLLLTHGYDKGGMVIGVQTFWVSDLEVV